MYFDLESGKPEVEEDFLTALNLLHSTDDDSAESLRRMLDNLIAEKVGPTRTLSARQTYRKGQGINLPSQNELARTQHPNNEELAEESTIRKILKPHVPPNTAVITKKIGQKMANVLVDVDRTEIPTISIPDEGSSAGDGALCKICSGPRLGPFILLECQECQDVYHPLCHQPPVLDLDIYDPRLVWHCAKCVELSEAAAAAVVTAAELNDKKFNRKCSGISIHEIDPTKDERISNDPKDQLNFFRRIESRLNSHQETSTSDQFQLRNRTSVGRRAAKRQTKSVEQVSVDRNGSIKNALQTLAFSTTPSSSGLHLRKRVGSKLTMTRGTAK